MRAGGRVKRQMHMQAGVGCVAHGGVLCVGAGRVVAALGDLPADSVPHLVQVLQLGCEHFFGVAPDGDFAYADGQRVGGGRGGGYRGGGGRSRAGFADEVAVLAQTVLAQGLHHGVAFCRLNLDNDTQLFVEQGLQGQLFAPRTHLAAPVFAVAYVHAAVADAVAFDQQHVDVQRYAHIASKGHLADGG